MEYSGAREKLNHEKNQKQKSRDTVPLTQVTGGLSMRVMFTKCDGDDLKLLGLDQLPYVMLRYVATFWSSKTYPKAEFLGVIGTAAFKSFPPWYYSLFI